MKRSLFVLIAGAVLFSQEAQTAIFPVSRFDDPLPTSDCITGSCSLRQAVIAARETPGSTIILPAGIYTLTIPRSVTNDNNPAADDLDILVATTIVGAGIGKTIVQVGSSPFSGTYRIFDNHSSAPSFISKMTIRNGNDSESQSGGCIRNLGVLILDSVMVAGCFSPVSGGAISSYHSLTVRNSTITNNKAYSTSSRLSTGGGILSGPGSVRGRSSTVTLEKSNIDHNVAGNTGNADLTAFGGGVSNSATLHIKDCSIYENSSLNVGGIINAGYGTMTITNSRIFNNRARFDVGGIDNEGTMAVSNSTISENVAGFECVGAECDRGFAGGLINTNEGGLTVNNSTFSGNTCVVGGGGILNTSGILTISSSTITQNSGGPGAGIAGGGAPITIKNSIVANNDPKGRGGNLSGTIISEGYNLFEDTFGSIISGNSTGNLIGVDARLGSLQNNGGPTKTHALSSDSPAVNSGNPDGCRDHAGTLLSTDQRGHIRIQNEACDIGSFEAENASSTINPIPNLILFELED